MVGERWISLDSSLYDCALATIYIQHRLISLYYLYVGPCWPLDCICQISESRPRIIRRIWCEPPLLKETSHQLKVSAADKYHSNNNRRHSPSDEPEDQYISVKRPQPHPCGQWSFLSPPIIPLPAATALSRVHGPRRGYKELGQSYWDEKPSCLSSTTICTNGRYLLDPFFLT